jgi:hypothetical protein
MALHLADVVLVLAALRMLQRRRAPHTFAPTPAGHSYLHCCITLICVAAGALYYFALAHQPDFDVRWCKGPIGEQQQQQLL